MACRIAAIAFAVIFSLSLVLPPARADDTGCPSRPQSATDCQQIPWPRLTAAQLARCRAVCVGFVHHGGTGTSPPLQFPNDNAPAATISGARQF